MTSKGLPTDNFFQLGYVTRDFEHAIEWFGAHQGVPNFLRLNLAEMAPPGVKAPNMLVALAYRGPVMIEIIRPDPEEPGIYGEALPAGKGVVLHHLGYLVEDANRWANVPQALAQAGYDIAFRSPADSPMQFAYADTRGELGHYVEFVHPGAMGSQLFQSLPRS